MDTYFSDITTGRSHFWYISGRTDDEFYLENGRKVELNELLYRELKECRFDRIVFYRPRERFYCFDDRSFALLTHRELPQEEPDAPDAGRVRRRGRGLRRGTWEDALQNRVEDTVQPEPRQPQRADDTGSHSGFSIRPQRATPLHAGTQADVQIFEETRGMLLNSAIKTALVVEDADNFLNQLTDYNWNALFNEISKVPAENLNIMIFIFPDTTSGQISRMEKLTQEKDRLQELNNIVVPDPNALEIINMLNMFRLRHGLHIHPREIPEVAREIARCSAKITQDQTDKTEGVAQGIRTRTLFHLLQKFAGSGETLRPENCCRLFAEDYGLERIPTAEEQLNSLIGMKSVKEQIVNRFRGTDAEPRIWMRNLTANRIKPPHQANDNMGLMHLALLGNPGTGKTTVARILGQFFFERGYLRTGHVVEVGRDTLVAGFVGQTAEKTHRQVMRALGGILFIDEAYALIQDEYGQDGHVLRRDDFGHECVDMLVRDMDRFKNDLIVIFAGYPDRIRAFLESNEGLPSRVRECIEIPDYTPEEMQAILTGFLTSRRLRFDDTMTEYLPEFCRNWVNSGDNSWGNAREAEKLANDLLTAVDNDGEAKKEEIDGKTWRIVEEKHLGKEYRKHLPTEHKDPEAILAELPGLDGIKEWIRSLKTNMDVGHLQEPGHYFFMGAPGTGKTTVARLFGTILRECKVLKRGHVVETDAADIIQRYQKRTEEALDGVLFIDEAYQLRTMRDGLNVIDSLVKFMEDNAQRVSVIFAGYEDEMFELLNNANAGLQSRISLVRFDNYTGEELYSIFCHMLASRGYQGTGEFMERSHRAIVRYTDTQADNPRFGNARYLRKTYLPDCITKLSERLRKEYGTGESIPEEARRLFTENDIPDSVVNLTYEPLPASDNRTLLEQIDDLVGFDEVKKRLKDMLTLAEFQRERQSGLPIPMNLNWVLRGNPGTGKTMVARLIGKVMRECGLLPVGKTYKVTRSDLVAPYVGQTAPKTRAWIQKAMGNVLFIDEAYQLAPRALQDGSNDFGPEAITEIVEAMTSHAGKFSVIVAGYPAGMDHFLESNQGLSSRFGAGGILTLPDYTPQELSLIFTGMAGKAGFILDPELTGLLPAFFTGFRDEVSRTGDWGNARQCESLLTDMMVAFARAPFYSENASGKRRQTFTTNHIPEKLRHHLKTRINPDRPVRSAMEEIDALEGMAELKTFLHKLENTVKTARERNDDALMRNLSLHIALTGNPGTGKTTVATLIGRAYREIGILERGHLVKVTRDDLVGTALGHTARQTKDKLNEAMNGVFFLDEAYSLVNTDPMGGHDSFGQEAINTIMETMSARDGLFSTIIAGYPNEIQQFLKSNPGLPSRFQGHIFNLPDYSTEQLACIFRSICERNGAMPDPELEKALPAIIDNMRNDVLRRGGQWANARMMEKMEGEFRTEWPEHPLNSEENGMRLYTLEHLPENYRKYVADPDADEEDIPLTAMEEIDRMCGMEELKKYMHTLRDRLRTVKENSGKGIEGIENLTENISFHMLLLGGPGTGKTTAAKLIARAFREIGALEGGHLVEAPRSELVGGYQGQSALKTTAKIMEAQGGVLFIDEAYSLKNSPMDSFGQEVIDTLVKSMSDRSGQFSVIAAGYPEEMETFMKSNSGLKSRFPHVFRLPDFTVEELIDIFKSKCKKKKVVPSPELLDLLPKLIEGMMRRSESLRQKWGNGREVENLLNNMLNEWTRNQQITEINGKKHIILTPDHLPENAKKLSEDHSTGRPFDEAGESYRLPADSLAKPDPAFSFEQGMEECSKGVVLIENVRAGGKSYGSGFLITSDGYIVTCDHVISGQDNLRVRLLIPGRTDGDVSWHAARVVRTDPTLDIALIKIDIYGYPALPILPRDRELRMVDDLFLLGYPFGAKIADSVDTLRMSKFVGTVSSFQTVNNLDLVYINMEAKSGCSGAPVFLKNEGVVVGILLGSATSTSGSLTEEVNYIRPVSYLWERFIHPEDGGGNEAN